MVKRSEKAADFVPTAATALRKVGGPLGVSPQVISFQKKRIT